MDKKEFLKQIRQIDQIILCNQEELKELQEQSTGIGAVDYGKERVRGSISTKEARFTEIVADIIQLKEQIQRDTERMLSIKHLVRTSIEKLESVEERLVLQRKYFLGESWKVVASQLKMSDSAVFRVHQSALEHLVLEI